MKLSARNMLKGKVKTIKTGSVNDEVVVVPDDGGEIIAMITRQSAERLGLLEGKGVYAIVKASNVMIGTD